MGYKYFIRFTRNGRCAYDYDRNTNNLFKAIWWLIILSIKYPIIDFQIRRGFISCDKCDADYCEKKGGE